MGTVESDGGRIEVVRVFTDAVGRYGNPLGIARFADFEGADHQALAARVGHSETVIVHDPADGRVSMRIYTPTTELPFAGHPSVGTAWWLRELGHPVTVLDVPAGPVDVWTDGVLTWARASALWVPKFELHEFAELAALETLTPVDFTDGAHYAWTWTDAERGTVRARMFAPALGIAEDEATGAAAVALTAVLRRSLIITQGRGSHLYTAWDSDGWVRVGGRVVADHPIVI